MFLRQESLYIYIKDARISFEKAFRQFIFVCAGFVISLLIPMVLQNMTLFRKLTWVYVMMASFGGGKEDTSGAGTGASVAGMAAAAKEAVAALTALGYTNMEASKAVKKVEITENMSVEDILKASLKYLSFL